MNHRIPVLLDGDPGHDDAIAWMLAATGLDIRGVSSVAGNQTIEKTTRNALRICTLLGIRAPVAMGLARPLLSEALTAPSVHGVSGLDGPALPELGNFMHFTHFFSSPASKTIRQFHPSTNR